MKPAVLRALWRLDTIWGVLLLIGMANALLMAVRSFGQGPALLHPGLGAGAEYTSAAVAAMVAFLFATGLGMLASGKVLELAGCGFTWCLPGFRRAARRDLWLLSLVAALPCLAMLANMDAGDLVAPAARPDLPLLGLLLLPPLGLASGMLVFDPRRPVALRLGGALLVLTVVLAMEHVLLWNTPLALVPAVLAAAALARVIDTSLSKRLGRELLLGGEMALTHANRHPFAPQPWERALRRGRLRDRPWTGGADAFRRAPLRVLDFERWGWSRGTHPVGRLGPAGLCVLMVVAFTLLLAQRVGLGLEETERLFLGLVWNARLLDGVGAGEDDVLHMLMPGALFLTFLTVGDRMQPALRPGALYPVSRRERARLLWAGGLGNWARAFGWTALALAVLAGAVAWSAGLGFGGPRDQPSLGEGPPYWVVCMLGCAALLPILQLGAGLRELYPGERLSPMHVLLTMTFLAAGFVGLLYAAVLNLAELHAFERWVFVAVAVPVAVLGQLAWRAYLQRRMARMDLA